VARQRRSGPPRQVGVDESGVNQSRTLSLDMGTKPHSQVTR